MLSELHIDNFAIISHVDLEFNPGLNIFTGETGAGKSIIIDAVEAILGSRGDVTMIRAGADKALVEAIFEIPGDIASSLQQIWTARAYTTRPNCLPLDVKFAATGGVLPG